VSSHSTVSSRHCRVPVHSHRFSRCHVSRCHDTTWISPCHVIHTHDLSEFIERCVKEDRDSTRFIKVSGSEYNLMNEPTKGFLSGYLDGFRLCVRKFIYLLEHENVSGSFKTPSW
jgi:hypothetical protein